jgi:hypothetical protein
MRPVIWTRRSRRPRRNSRLIGRSRHLRTPSAGKLTLTRGGVDGVAVGSSRHQAILHLAGGGQLMGQPHADRQQHDRDGQTRQRPASASTLFRFIHEVRHNLGIDLGPSRHRTGRSLSSLSAGASSRLRGLAIPPNRSTKPPRCAHAVNLGGHPSRESNFKLQFHASLK